MKTQIFQQDNLALGHFLHDRFHFFTHTIGCQNHLHTKERLKMPGHRCQAEFFNMFAFRAPHMRTDDQSPFLLQDVADGGKYHPDTNIICDLL